VAAGDDSPPSEVAGTREYHIVFFDGICGLCDRFVWFVLDRDRRAKFRFAALQSPLAQALLPAHAADPERLDTLYVLTRDAQLHARSRAVLFTLEELGGIYRCAALARVLPARLCDALYDLVARWRYRVFGKVTACRVPAETERRRFLHEAEG
jgi:predicted DCC family thiol-disulfide oxidoreductase YuxK